ncbi:HEPN domain-containing protein [Marinomonas agarivorans]|nr:HEPN domain-containing protein [Marinomonas agarivorans]
MNVITNELRTALNPVLSHVPSSEFPINQEPLSHFPINKEPLSHLPEPKRQQLQKAVALILSNCQPSIVLLFGSYARGDWLQTPSYQSSFDLLVVTKNALAAKKLECKRALHKQLMLEVETPINLIAEDIQFVNRRIGKGQYFYTDMLHDGIVLHDSGEHQLAAPSCLHSSPLQLAERKKLAEADFTHWFGKAMTFKKGFTWYLGERDYNEAAFLLHQIVERLYGAVLLVFTRYRPKSHDLGKLGQRIASIEPQFLTVFPQGSEEDKTKFELLRQAYVNARYNPNFGTVPKSVSTRVTLKKAPLSH